MNNTPAMLGKEDDEITWAQDRVDKIYAPSRECIRGTSVLNRDKCLTAVTT